MNPTIGDKILELAHQALNELDTPNRLLSSVIRKCIRIARLRNDFDNLLWLELEMRDFSDKQTKRKILLEIAFHYAKDDFKELYDRVLASYMTERSCRQYDDHSKTLVDKGNLTSRTVSELEDAIQELLTEASSSTPPSGLHPVDLYVLEEQYSNKRTMLRLMASEYSSVLRKIENRAHEFLSLTEKQLIFSQINADIFERNRHYVDEHLKAISPEALDQLIAAFRRVNESSAESRSQALLSCRRILKTLADRLYPAKDTPVVGADGKERILTDDKFISRLWQFIFERTNSSKSRDLLNAQLQDLGNRIDRLYQLSSKGVHDSVGEFELNQCVIQTYLTVGDILRLAESDSATDDTIIDELLK
ncbi:MAG: hypothetical protein Q8P51_13140 [Ignavibacteria bacterium]|nr:hypothetical protein [Ignavibacteria bacterium]